MCKRDDRPPNQKNRFFIASEIGFPLYISTSMKALKYLLQNIYLLLDLLYHKHNPFITTTVENNIFKKIFYHLREKRSKDIIFTQLLQR